MAWWPTERPGEITGDEVADEIRSSFEFLQDMENIKPTWQQLIDATAQIVVSDGGVFLSDADAVSAKPIEAVFAGASPALVSKPGAPIDGLLFMLGGLFRKISDLYIDTPQHRKPHLTEILHGLALVLRKEPERVQSEGRKLVAFRIKEG